MQAKKLTPILFTDDVEACVAFWEDLGFQAPVSVPHQDRLGFVILQKDDVELMYQSFASQRADLPEALEGVERGMIYVEVASLEPVRSKAETFEVVVPERTTFYGAREIWVRDPAGNMIGFAEMRTEPAGQTD